VYVRKNKDNTLTFIVSGMLWRNSLIMQDTETNSYWSHITGAALWGELQGEKLTIVPVVQSTWSQWQIDHPKTLLLKKSREVKSSAYEDYFRDQDRAGLFRTQWLMEKMPAKEIVHGLAVGPHALAIPEVNLEQGELIQTSLGEEDILIIHTEDGGVRSYRTRIEKLKLTFPENSENYIIADKETHSLWNLNTGECVEGEMLGMRLPEIQVLEIFWFAWSSFYPNTRVID
jgi:hypothetical protein